MGLSCCFITQKHLLNLYKSIHKTILHLFLISSVCCAHSLIKYTLARILLVLLNWFFQPLVYTSYLVWVSRQELTGFGLIVPTKLNGRFGWCWWYSIPSLFRMPPIIGLEITAFIISTLRPMLILTTPLAAFFSHILAGYCARSIRKWKLREKV